MTPLVSWHTENRHRTTYLPHLSISSNEGLSTPAGDRPPKSKTPTRHNPGFFGMSSVGTESLFQAQTRRDDAPAGVSSSAVTSLAVTAMAPPRWRHGCGFGLKTAGPVFTFQADTPVTEGHQVNKGKVTGLVTGALATPGREVPSTRNRTANVPVVIRLPKTLDKPN